MDEKRFIGPIHHQIRQCLGWLENQVTQHFEKQASAAITKEWGKEDNRLQKQIQRIQQQGEKSH